MKAQAGAGKTYAPTTRYPAEGAKVRKNGGNDAIHDHRKTQGPSVKASGSTKLVGERTGSRSD